MSIPERNEEYEKLISVDGIESKTPDFIIWSARLDIKCAIAKLEVGLKEEGLAELKVAVEKLNLLRI